MLTAQDEHSQLPVPAALLFHRDGRKEVLTPLELCVQINPYKQPWPWCFSRATEKQLRRLPALLILQAQTTSFQSFVTFLSLLCLCVHVYMRVYVCVCTRTCMHALVPMRWEFSVSFLYGFSRIELKSSGLGASTCTY